MFYIRLFTYSAVGTVPMTAPIRENTCKSETLRSLGQKLIIHLDGLKPESLKKARVSKEQSELHMGSCI